MDVGVYWSRAVLEHKLERLDEPAPGPLEEVWNCRRLPTGLGKDAAGDRLFVACDGRWVGFMRLMPDVLYSPDDPSAPYTLIFDVSTWRDLSSAVPRTRFRGFTYSIPDEALREAATRPALGLPPPT